MFAISSGEDFFKESFPSMTILGFRQMPFRLTLCLTKSSKTFVRVFFVTS